MGLFSGGAALTLKPTKIHENVGYFRTNFQALSHASVVIFEGVTPTGNLKS